MNRFTAVSFTGHRPDGLIQFNSTAQTMIEQTLAEDIEEAIAKGATIFYSGMAMGTDLIAANAVAYARKKHPEIRLVAVLPFETQAVGYDPNWKILYDQLLSMADEVICLAKQYHANCYRVRNQWLVDHCDRLVAVYNGASRSGTAQTIRMGARAGKQLHIYMPDAQGNICCADTIE